MSTIKPSKFLVDDIKCKRYPHLDFPFTSRKSLRRVYCYITNTQCIERHAFYPFIRNLKITRRWKYDNGIRVAKDKIREITYASHIDSAIYTYYACILQERYEQMLSDSGIDEVAVAYRKIPVEGRKSNKCNIDIANDVFDYISEKLNKEPHLVAIAFDIKGFFDNLNYALIFKSWKTCLGIEKLPKDWYKVFKSITEYAYVYDNKVFDVFKDRIYCKPLTGSKKYTQRKIKSINYLRDKGAVAFCKGSDIKELRKRDLIRTHRNGKHGIPQGLPISSVTANLYMFDFDRIIAKYVGDRNGLYRRYSDDIIVVCPQKYCHEIRNEIVSRIKKYKLIIQDSKTEVIKFDKDENNIKCSDENGYYHPLEYLGFSFNGNKKLIKSASLGKYYHKMYNHIGYACYAATHIYNINYGRIFKGRLIRRYTPIGSKVYKIKERSSKFPSIQRIHYGNFFSYVYRSSEIMNAPEIKHQLFHNGRNLRKKIVKAGMIADYCWIKHSDWYIRKFCHDV